MLQGYYYIVEAVSLSMKEMHDILGLDRHKAPYNTLLHLLRYLGPFNQHQHLDHLSTGLNKVLQQLFLLRHITHRRKPIVSPLDKLTLRLSEIKKLAITASHNPLGNKTNGYAPLRNPLQVWRW
jgi:hypothetical protein